MPHPASDRELVERHKAGDARALVELVDRHHAWLERWIAPKIPAVLRRRVSSEDLTQEVWIVVARRLREFTPRGEGDGALRGWLVRIAELRLKEALRRDLVAERRTVAREVSRPDRPETARLPGAEATPSAHAVAHETERAVRRAFDRLSPDSQRVLRLVRVRGSTLAQAAGEMGRSREATRKLFERALARLAELVESERGPR